MPAFEGDGSEVEVVWRLAKQAVEQARLGLGPSFLHITCAHFEGHMLGDALLRAVRRPHRDGMQLSGPLLRSMVRRQGAHVRERTEAFRLISDMMPSVRADHHNSKLDPVQKLRRSLVTETVSDRPNHLLANVGQTKMALCRLMMSVPSRLRTRLPLYLLGVLVFLQLVEPHQTWMALLVGLSALLGISYLWAREMRDKIQVERSSRGNWIVVGDTLEERFQLHNRSTFPCFGPR